VKSYSGFLDETDRSESDWRSESPAGNIARQQTEQGQISMQPAVMGDAESYARRSTAQLAGETGSFAGSGLTTTHGVRGPGGADVFAAALLRHPEADRGQAGGAHAQRPAR